MADPTTNVQGTARALAIDAVTARVVSELRQNGVGPLLLKGAAVSRWLYGDDGSRWYADLDLLVGPQDLGRAEQVLGDLSAMGPACDESNSATFMTFDASAFASTHTFSLISEYRMHTGTVLDGHQAAVAFGSE